MNINFDEIELQSRARLAVMNFYRSTIERVGKEYFSVNPVSGQENTGLRKTRDAFLTIISGVNFTNNIIAEIEKFIVNTATAYLIRQPAPTAPDYATHPTTILHSRVLSLATPRIDAAIDAELPALVSAKLDELVTPESISSGVQQVLTPELITQSIREVLTPAAIREAVAADAAVAMNDALTPDLVRGSVAAVLGTIQVQEAIRPLAEAHLATESFQARLQDEIVAHLNTYLAVRVAQVLANKLEQPINIMVDQAIANTVMPQVNPGEGTVTP